MHIVLIKRGAHRKSVKKTLCAQGINSFERGEAILLPSFVITIQGTLLSGNLVRLLSVSLVRTASDKSSSDLESV